MKDAPFMSMLVQDAQSNKSKTKSMCLQRGHTCTGDKRTRIVFVVPLNCPFVWKCQEENEYNVYTRVDK